MNLKAYKFLYIASLCFLFISYSFKAQNEIRHSIKVIHEGISLSEAVECVLVEVQDTANKPKEFYMDVESVVCGDSRCRVDLVRIYWNKLGQYNRLELPNGIELEKAEGEDFTPDDYAKLDRILQDENSSLKEVYKNEIVSTIGGEGVDGMTGATVLVEKSAYVEGAVWTCYSLWHWTHGETKQIIRNLTGDSYLAAELQDLLQTTEYQAFAIEQLTRRQDFSEKTVDLIQKAIEKDPILIALNISYLNNASTSIFEESLLRLIEISKTPNRLLCLNAILKSKKHLSKSFFHQLSQQLSKFSYQEIHVFLNILKKRNALTIEITDQLLPLLDSQDFLIARRVYWVLSEEALSSSAKKMLEIFYRNNEDKL